MSERRLMTAMVLHWNAAHLLPDCRATLAEQHWPEIEMMVVDNASVDDNRTVRAARGAGRRTEVLMHEALMRRFAPPEGGS